MNIDIESRVGAAFSAQAAQVHEGNLSSGLDVALAPVAYLPQRRRFVMAGVAAAAVLVAVGGGLGLAAVSGSSHSGVPAGANPVPAATTPSSNAPTAAGSAEPSTPAYPTPTTTAPLVTCAEDYGCGLATTAAAPPAAGTSVAVPNRGTPSPTPTPNGNSYTAPTN